MHYFDVMACCKLMWSLLFSFNLHYNQHKRSAILILSMQRPIQTIKQNWDILACANESRPLMYKNMPYSTNYLRVFFSRHATLQTPSSDKDMAN